MKNAYLLLLTAGLLGACGRSEKAQDTTTQSTTAATGTDAAKAPAPKNCQSVLAADKLGKPLEYRETAKPIKVSITLDQDTSAVQTANGCYFNNTFTVLTTKKSGKQMFKRTLLKDDLLYFVDNDDAVKQAVLQNVTYKPTFNGERYFNLSVQLVEPVSKKTLNYTLFVNYYGEIVKIK